MDQLILFVNGTKRVIRNPDPEATLLQYLRNDLRLTGTKLGCGEGGCGACTVMVTRYDCGKETFKHMSVNACLAPLCSLHGMGVTTVEGIGSTKNGLHPVQERLAKSHGSQCGFCTPGIIMSMYALLCNDPHPSESSMEKTFEGNLCRCTGYRPILDGFRTFVQPASGDLSNGTDHRHSHDDSGCSNGHQCSGKNVNCRGKECKGGNRGCHKVASDETEKISNGLVNAQEFIPFDSTQHVMRISEEFEAVAKECDKQSLYFKSDRVAWFRPKTLREVIELKEKHPNAKIVIGNTEIGVEVKFKNMHYPVIIAATHVSELNSVEYTDNGIRFGASVTLATLEHTLLKAIEELEEHKTRIFAAVVEVLRWFAGQQIRNVAAVGGNIITASPISDLNPLFLSAGCTLTASSVNGGRRIIKMDCEFFTGYRKTKLLPNEVLLSIDIPFTHENEYFQGYKQAQRREDDIAIVNAGMKVVFEDGSSTIKNVAMSFGGMAPVTVMATKTANQIIGQKWNDDLIPTVTKLLAEELPLAPGTPGGMEAYRCSLTSSFFYKFYLTVRLALQQKTPTLFESTIPDRCLSATKTYGRDPSKGVQLFEDVPDGQIKVDAVGRPVPHLSSCKQTTGEAVYVDDMPIFRDECYLALVVSTKAHAKILSIDTSEALRMPGVVDFLTWKDIPGQNIMDGVVLDETVFAEDLVTCQGMVIGAVLADNQTHAQRAAKAVKVEYEELKPVITIEDAIAANSYLAPPRTVKNGDAASAMSVADHVVEGELRIGGQEHFYLETQATLAVPKKEDSEMEIFCAAQDPTRLQRAAAKVLGVDYNRIVARVKRLGGGFGGKECRFLLVALPVAVAAHKHNRPVRCMLDRDEDMVITGARHPYLARYKVGFTKEGKILALELDLYQNCGNTVDLSLSVIEKALFQVDNAYNIPNVRVTGYTCRTNIPSNTAFRGFGTPQAVMICETWMTDVSKILKMSPLKIRELNMYKEGELTYYNQPVLNCTLQRCWDELLKHSDYDNRQLKVDEFNSKNRWMKRGIATMPLKFGFAFEFMALNKGAALVHIYTDGSVLLSYGGVEMGQGLNTKMIQVASRVLKIPTSKIYISECSSSSVTNGPPTAASISSDLSGMAVMDACQILMERLDPYTKSTPEGPWESWITAAYMDRVNLSATGFYKSPYVNFDYETNSGTMYDYFSIGAACSEVEIDCLTGDHTVIRTDIVMDVGKSLNPAIDIGQIEGAFVQGYGYVTLEEQKYSPTGYLYNRGPGAYKIPSFSNIPVEFNVTLLKDAPNPKAVYSSKGIGEPPLCLSATVWMAIKEAIEAARKEVGLDGLFRLDSPATAERIRMACVDEFTKAQPEFKPGTFTPWYVQL